MSEETRGMTDWCPEQPVNLDDTRGRELRPAFGEWADLMGEDPEDIKGQLEFVTGVSDEAQLDGWVKMIQAGQDPFENHPARKSQAEGLANAASASPDVPTIP